VRRLLLESHRLVALEDWSDGGALFDAAVYPSLVVAARGTPEAEPRSRPMRITVHAARVAAMWDAHAGELGIDETPGAPWLMLPPIARRAFDALRSAGIPLAASAFGAPLLGVKCGCNGAFILTADENHRTRSGTGVTVAIEPEVLRPLIRGEHVGRWRCNPNGEQLIWTHGDDGLPLDRLPPRAERWLRGWRRRLIARSDARGSQRWWTLFRTDAAAHDVARVVWADFGRAPRAAVLLPGDRAVPLNTCYVVRCADARDAHALAAVLNSALAAAWLGTLAEPARGGYRRYLGWTMSLLPLPVDWAQARTLLAPMGERAAAGDPPADAELLDAVMRAFGIRRAAVSALLDWGIR
jgi:hypothetical protein